MPYTWDTGSPIPVYTDGGGAFTYDVDGMAATFAWHVNIDQVYVCENGLSVQTGFPNGMFDMLAAGAEFGRCEHLD